MAVKKHKLVHDNTTQLDIVALAQYIQLMNEQPSYMPPASDLVKYCTDIVKCLALSTTPCDMEGKQLLAQELQPIEEFLQRVSTSLSRERRHEFVTVILDKFYSIISDPQSDASPTTSIVLSLLGGNNSEAAIATARWVIKKGKEGPTNDAGLRASLNCLYRWLYDWNCTESLAGWVIGFIKTLEEEECIDILIDVSIDNLEKLFGILFATTSHRQAAAPVLVHVLACMREFPGTLEKIASQVRPALEWLASDTGQWTRQLLQDLVDIISATMTVQYSRKTPNTNDEDKYIDVRECLESHMASSRSRHLTRRAWLHSSSNARPSLPSSPVQVSNKVGLLNLGNTCYMNSIMQALLLTRQFSRHTVMNMHSIPYWSKMGHLFSKMMHSHSNNLNPGEFFHIVKPPFFTRDNQHDSSEFLVYLLGLLQSFEHSTEKPEVAERPITNKTLRAITFCSTFDYESEPTTQGSSSPRPGGSNSSSSGSPNSLKRQGTNDLSVTPRKRSCYGDVLRKRSFIQNMFGGVQLTRIECTECRSSSLSRDMFRDLQLSFPEKTECGQHSIQSLLEYYCSTELLSGSNRYDCRDCGGLRNAERSVMIETPPKYLILVLKYFRFDPKLQVQTKLMHSVYHNHSVILPTVHFQEEHSTYELYAAVIHDGTTLDSGHYYTLGRDHDQWHTYNDEIVQHSSEEELNTLNRSRTPYILFYRRCDIEESTIPSITELPPVLAETLLSHNKMIAEEGRLRPRR